MNVDYLSANEVIELMAKYGLELSEKTGGHIPDAVVAGTIVQKEGDQRALLTNAGGMVFVEGAVYFQTIQKVEASLQAKLFS